jgi:protein involved in polysaccharide export with SLBB domain
MLKNKITIGRLLLVLMGIWLSCAPPPAAVPDQPPVVAQKNQYILGPRDVVDITVSGHQELSGKAPIDNNGNIELPLTEESVPAAGLTIDELSQKVSAALAKYVTSQPHIKIKIAEYESKVEYVVGAVGMPGKYPLKEYIVRVRDIIFDAGLTRDDADLSRVYIIKPDLTDPTHQTINLHDILYKGILKENYRLEPGDIVYVRTTTMSKINKVFDQLLTPASKAAALYYLTTQFGNLINSK